MDSKTLPGKGPSVTCAAVAWVNENNLSHRGYTVHVSIVLLSIVHVLAVHDGRPGRSQESGCLDYPALP